jgi:hypothetical protein
MPTPNANRSIMGNIYSFGSCQDTRQGKQVFGFRDRHKNLILEHGSDSGLCEYATRQEAFDDIERYNQYVVPGRLGEIQAGIRLYVKEPRTKPFHIYGT